MNGRLPTLVMVFVALAIVISLVVALAPDAGAQDSVTAPDVPATWMRHNIPAAQDLQTTCCANAIPDGVGFKFETPCAITTGGCPPQPPSPPFGIGSEQAGIPFTGQGRWICSGAQ